MPFVPIRAVTACLVGLAISSISAQDVVFRARVDLITVDATVLGTDGYPVSGLGPEDFVLKVDGKARSVVSAQFITQTVARAGEESVAEVRHFTSNESVDAGRFVVVAVDEAHIRRLEGRTALRAAAAFLDVLDPMDRIAVAPLSRIGMMQFTRDRAELKRRLDTLTGQTDPVFLQFNLGLTEAIEIADGGRARLAQVVLRECGRSLTQYTNPARSADDAAGGRDACPEQVEQESRAMSQHARTQARISLSAIEALIASLKAIDGPKTVVLLSEGMILDPRLVDLAELAAAAKDARVTIYVLHIEVPMFEASTDRVSPTFLNDVQLRGDGLARVAGATRGALFPLVGGDPKPFERIARELSGYYLLGFEAEDRDRDGRIHRVEVALRRGGRVLRARTAFRMPTVTASPRTREQELVGLLRTSRTATELPVRVATYTYAEPGSSRLRVVVSAESDVPGGPASHVLLGYVLIDGRGVITASGAAAADAQRYAFSTVVEGGSYTLRVGAIDPLGRRGLVERPFRTLVGAHAGLQFSDLMLAPVPVQKQDSLQPFVDRITEPQVTAYLELYGLDATGPDAPHVVFEILPATLDGAVISVPAELMTHNAGWAVARRNVSLRTLPAGRYVAQARIAMPGRGETHIARPFTYEP